MTDKCESNIPKPAPDEIEVWDWYVERHPSGTIFRVHHAAEEELRQRFSDPQNIEFHRIEGTRMFLPKVSPFPYFD